MTSGPAAGILAERPMYFNYQGRTGGDVVVGTQTLGTSLNLAEGFVSPNFNEYLTILNPNAATAYVAINYLTDKQGVVIKNVVVPGNSRFTEKVDNDLNQYISSSVNITSNVGIAVERPMYFNFNGWTGGHDAMAVPDSALGMTFNFAEGFVSPNFAEYYTFENNKSGVALVSVRFLLTGGGVITKSLAVAAHSRSTLQVGGQGGVLNDYTANSTQITSSANILVERPMYFSY
jgi:hypothetical protein